MKKSSKPAAPQPRMSADMASQGMSMTPSAEHGVMGHWAHLHQTVGTPSPVTEPMPSQYPMPRKR